MLTCSHKKLVYFLQLQVSVLMRSSSEVFLEVYLVTDLLSCALKTSPVTRALLPLWRTRSCEFVRSRAQVKPFCHSASCVRLKRAPIMFNGSHISSIRRSICGVCFKTWTRDGEGVASGSNRARE